MPSPRLTSPTRTYASDHVLERLALVILRKEFHRGQPLPSERELSEQFHVSRLIIRQALHRLAEMGLVEIRQGGATIVADLDLVTDLRVLTLFYRLTPAEQRKAADIADIIEKQYMQGLSMIEVASRRASKQDLVTLLRMVDGEHATTGAEVEAFEHSFWQLVSSIGRNRIFMMEVAWWYRALPDRPIPPEVASAEPQVRVAFYRELARRLVENDHPVEYYMAAVRPILDAVIARSGK